jgi:polyphosphate kinase
VSVPLAGRHYSDWIGKTSTMEQLASSQFRSTLALAPVEREFLDRDLSWLEFNRRVLHEALDERTPLLERLRFLGIFASNLDEFFMKRVGRLKRSVAPGVVSKRSEEMDPAKVLFAVRQAIMPMLAQQADCFSSAIMPRLAENGVRLLKWEDLTATEKTWATEYFRTSVFPVLTPLAVDPGHPFPFLSNLSTSLGVVLSQPDREELSFARVKVPEVIPRWIRLSQDVTDEGYRFVSLLELIRQNLRELFPGMLVLDDMPFRITRDAEVESDEDETDDLRDMVEQEVRQRRFGQVVRLEYSSDVNRWILQLLMQELKLTADDVYAMPAELEYNDLRPVAQLNLPKLRYEPWVPTVPPALADDQKDIFAEIRGGDILVHHPYESFNASVERFVQAAAADPRVLAIKMTVYRTGDDSPFLHTLIRAAEAKKQVVCLVELKARFDEERNILLAQKLEEAGVHVVYGLVGLKTHTKATLVVRQDPDGIRCYAHVGTGNYHAETARLYTDLGLLTCQPRITEDLVKLFHYLSGRSLQRDYPKLLVAPCNMRERFLAMIEREIECHQAGRPAQIIGKMNSLEDHKVIRALYRASNAGVPIDLIVRGFCCLRPGVAGLSPTIRVSSVIGRFLEHSRIFYFRNGAGNPQDGEFYIGSADWMYRNLLYRVEVVTPVQDRALCERLWEVLQITLKDNISAWDMQPDGVYVQRRPAEGQQSAGTQQTLMNLARQRSAAATGRAINGNGQ